MTQLQYDFIDIFTLSDSELNSTLSLMTEQKRARVLGFPDADNRRRSIAAEFIARSLVSRLLSLPKSEIIIDHRPSGQPFLPGLPLHISLSHSGHLAMAAVSNRPVGADIEIISERGERLMSRVCTSEEQEYILASGCFDPLRFFSVWTAKESILKHSGRGLSGGFSSTVAANRSSLLSEIDGITLTTGIFEDAAYSIYC